MKNIKDYNLDELKQEITQLGEKPFRAEQIFKWLFVDKVKSFDEMTNLQEAKLDAMFKSSLISVLIYIEALFKILDEKSIINKDEIEQQYKTLLEENETWKDFLIEMKTRLEVIEHYENDPKSMFEDFFEDLMKTEEK